MSSQKYSQIAIEALVEYENNARTHSDEQIEKIARSIEEFGFVNPVLIDEKNMIIAGHGRVRAAKKLGIKKVPCVRVEGLTETQIKAYILADNKLAEDAGWDDEILKRELQDLKDNGFELSLTGFSIDDISFEEIDFTDIDDKIDLAEENAIKNPIAKRGKRYNLGGHILMVGDSTNPKDVQALMDGAEADLVITDPPYNLDYVGKTKDSLKIKNDNMSEGAFITFLTKAFNNMQAHLKAGGAFYIWLPSNHIDNFQEALRNNGLEMRELLIWVKNVFALGRQDYQWRHEPCIYGWKEGAAHYFIDDRTKSTVFEKPLDVEAMTEAEAKNLLKRFYIESETKTTTLHEDKPSRSELHPTMKPIALMEKQIEFSSKEGETVLDLFGGSGSTLIACENKNRRCYMMEFDEHYADVIIQRWEELTGRKAELI